MRAINREQAVRHMNSFKGGRIRLVTSDYVFDETITGIRFQVGHEKAVEVGRLMMSSRGIWIAESA